MTEADEFWNEFLKATGRDEEERCAGDLNFEAKGFVADEMIALVLSGKKTAFFTSWSTYAIDQEPVPVSGELYLVLDRNEKPVCVIETQSVQVIPFNEVTWEMAKLEGEDENLEVWREKKREYLEEEGDIMGFEFTPDIKLVFQTFSVVYKK
ncbi:MAG: ASCH domain-containing protein [Spirochaetales bacterium]|nr:ASCH domain-containing protein [Spirochaetales bacterium]